MALPIAMGMGTGTGGGSGWLTTAVEKATSELLIGPDWTMNIEICDSINSHHLQVKDVVKCIKKRLQHKNSHVQILALTLLETMMKNCGEQVHFQVAESLLNELVKIVKKRTDMRVRDKILSLLLSWQEAFGGAGGKHPRYYWAYDELRRSGVQFPQRSLDSAPLFTPPISKECRRAQVGNGMPSNSSRRLDEAMAADNEGLSIANLDSIRDAMELLNEMLQAVNPNDREAVNDEIISDLVNCCRSNQKKLIQMLTTTGDEDLLGRGLELNDNLQSLLAKHDAIASGYPIPVIATASSSSMSSEVVSPPPLEKPSELKMDPSENRESKVSGPDVNVSGGKIVEDCEEDEFTQLARRHSKATQDAETMMLVKQNESSPTSSSSDATCSALAVIEEAQAPERSKQQDMIDLLSLTVTTVPSYIPATPPANPNVETHSSMEGYSKQLRGQSEVPYVASWAQSRPQPQLHSIPHTQARPQYPQAYPAPPWAPTPGYYTGQVNPFGKGESTAAGSVQAVRPVQQNYSFPARESIGGVSREGAQKPFIPPYRLFEDLNVLGNNGSSGQGMVGGRK